MAAVHNMPARSQVGRSRRERRNLWHVAAYSLCLLQTCAESRRNGTLRMGPRRCFAPGPLRNRGSLRRVSGVFWAPGLLCNYPVSNSHYPISNLPHHHWILDVGYWILDNCTIAKGSPKMRPSPPPLAIKRLRTGDYRCAVDTGPYRSCLTSGGEKY